MTIVRTTTTEPWLALHIASVNGHTHRLLSLAAKLFRKAQVTNKHAHSHACRPSETRLQLVAIYCREGCGFFEKFLPCSRALLCQPLPFTAMQAIIFVDRLAPANTCLCKSATLTSKERIIETPPKHFGCIQNIQNNSFVQWFKMIDRKHEETRVRREKHKQTGKRTHKNLLYKDHR